MSSLKFKDGEITGSSGVAKAGLALGIVGTALGAMGGCGNILGLGCNGCGRGIFGGCNGCSGNGWGNFAYGPNAGYGINNFGWTGLASREIAQSEISCLETKIAELESMRYTDYVGLDLYKNIIATAKEEDAKISGVQKELLSYVIELDKQTALNKQASDYQFMIMNNKVDCCCDKMNMQLDFNQQINALADQSIVSYVNSNFIPGTLKLPITSICPEPAVATTTA